MRELYSLGQPRKHKLPGTAIICGGSIAGIVTARICADHFERVVVIDPEIQDAEKPKTRIMQYNAAHGFLSLFLDGARRLWPNFDTEIQAAGGRICPADLQLHYSGVPILTPYKEYPSGRFPDSLIIRRSMLQRVLHRFLLHRTTASNIAILAGSVRGLNASEDRGSIQSVVVRESDGTNVSLNNVAMLTHPDNPIYFTDCTGAAQLGFKWLKAAGFSLSDDTRHYYNANIGYVTVSFFVPAALAAKLPIPEAQKKTLGVHLYFPHDDTTSSAFALGITDNNIMQLILGSTTGRELPRTAPDVVHFITGFEGYHMPIPPWVIETVEILCEHGNPSFDNIKISTYTLIPHETQSYVRYDRAPPGAIPSNFVALGDASLQLNPIHGQGVAKIMMNGITLNALLKAVCPDYSLPINFSARYFKNSASSMEGLCRPTSHPDYGSSSCEPMKGETKETGRFMRWFERKLLSAATKEAEVASALWHVRHMHAADKVLFAPTVLWKILRTRSMF
ncbi:hypothetical protein FB451DRAFT_1042298 [Mycena latifolia]|nr:hypothetical protein FB451DRAFT_1042298 [Mycena latifolia]